MESLMEALDVKKDAGISTTSLHIRDQVFGNHQKELPSQTPFFTLLIGTLEDFMLQVLIVCAIFSITVDMSFATPHERGHAWIEGTAILIAVAVVSFVTAWSDYSKEKQFLKQQEIAEMAKTVKVMRDSKECKIHRNFLMVGDIVLVENGMNVPVDGIILNGSVGIMCDESAMTGESDHLPKDSVDKCKFRQAEHESDGKFDKNPHDVPSPVLLSGTQIQTGQGYFLCAVVGDDTCEN
jgi:magnesium-transporting ATPase (P-type)